MKEYIKLLAKFGVVFYLKIIDIKVFSAAFLVNIRPGF